MRICLEYPQRRGGAPMDASLLDEFEARTAADVILASPGACLVILDEAASGTIGERIDRALDYLAASVRVVRLAAPFKGPVGLQNRVAASLGVGGEGFLGDAHLINALGVPEERGRSSLVLAIERAHLMGVPSLQRLWTLHQNCAAAGVRLRILLLGEPSLRQIMAGPALADFRAALTDLDLAASRSTVSIPPPPAPFPATDPAVKVDQFFADAATWTAARGLVSERPRRGHTSLRYPLLTACALLLLAALGGRAWLSPGATSSPATRHVDAPAQPITGAEQSRSGRDNTAPLIAYVSAASEGRPLLMIAETDALETSRAANRPEPSPAPAVGLGQTHATSSPISSATPLAGHVRSQADAASLFGLSPGMTEGEPLLTSWDEGREEPGAPPAPPQPGNRVAIELAAAAPIVAMPAEISEGRSLSFIAERTLDPGNIRVADAAARTAEGTTVSRPSPAASTVVPRLTKPEAQHPSVAASGVNARPHADSLAASRPRGSEPTKKTRIAQGSEFAASTKVMLVTQPGRTPAPDIQRLTAILRRAGIPVWTFAARSGAENASLRVGYYFSQDRAEAKRITALLAQFGMHPSARQLPFPNSPPPPGTIQVALAAF